MKKYYLFIFFTLSSNIWAYSGLELDIMIENSTTEYEKKFYQSGCRFFPTLEYGIGYSTSIIQKLDSNNYLTNEGFIVQTAKTKFEGTGRIQGQLKTALFTKLNGSREITQGNGFSKKVTIYKEDESFCKDLWNKHEAADEKRHAEEEKKVKAKNKKAKIEEQKQVEIEQKEEKEENERKKKYESLYE